MPARPEFTLQDAIGAVLRHQGPMARRDVLAILKDLTISLVDAQRAEEQAREEAARTRDGAQTPEHRLTWTAEAAGHRGRGHAFGEVLGDITPLLQLGFYARDHELIELAEDREAREAATPRGRTFDEMWSMLSACQADDATPSLLLIGADTVGVLRLLSDAVRSAGAAGFDVIVTSPLRTDGFDIAEDLYPASEEQALVDALRAAGAKSDTPLLVVVPDARLPHKDLPGVIRVARSSSRPVGVIGAGKAPASSSLYDGASWALTIDLAAGPAPQDTLVLLEQPPAVILQALAEAAREADPNLGQVAAITEVFRMAVVDVLRTGTFNDLEALGGAISRFMVVDYEAVEAVDRWCADQIAGLLPLVTIARRPDGRGSFATVVRSMGPEARGALAAIARSDERSLTRPQVAAAIGVDGPMATFALQGLAAADLVEPIHDPDRNVTDWVLTGRGVEAHAAVAAP
jgi:hypothetical protein